MLQSVVGPVTKFTLVFTAGIYLFDSNFWG